MSETKLKTTREQKGLKQEDVAKQANKSLRTYQRYEDGECEPRASTAKLIAKALNSTVEELF